MNLHKTVENVWQISHKIFAKIHNISTYLYKFKLVDKEENMFFCAEIFFELTSQ